MSTCSPTKSAATPRWADIVASLRRLGATAVRAPRGLVARILQRLGADGPPHPKRPLLTFRILPTPPDRQPTRPLPKAS